MDYQKGGSMVGGQFAGQAASQVPVRRSSAEEMVSTAKELVELAQGLREDIGRKLEGVLRPPYPSTEGEVAPEVELPLLFDEIRSHHRQIKNVLADIREMINRVDL